MRIGLLFLSLLLLGCAAEQAPSAALPATISPLPEQPYLQVLGIAQDAGFPQMDCRKACCARAWKEPALRRKVSCLAIVDPVAEKAWLIDATPDFRDQWQDLREQRPELELGGILLTHAHIGHYTGLMQLGREVMGARKVPVYAMSRMRTFLAANGPWSQLVSLENIELKAIKADSLYTLSEGLQFRPFRVPHRGEFSETVGYEIIGRTRRGVFIPDIDKWKIWERSIAEVITKTDVAFLDGTFFRNGEIPGRDMSEIPHPFVEESMAVLGELPKAERQKVHFIHFNHTNPLLDRRSEARAQVLESGFQLAEELQIVELD
ncbi:MAG: MBL fold metallo-hydrolase [Bacteroidota bacterium]